MADVKKVKKLLATIKGDPIEQHTITILDSRDERKDIINQFYCDSLGEDIVIEVIDNREQVDD